MVNPAYPLSSVIPQPSIIGSSAAMLKYASRLYFPKRTIFISSHATTPMGHVPLVPPAPPQSNIASLSLMPTTCIYSQ